MTQGLDTTEKSALSLNMTRDHKTKKNGGEGAKHCWKHILGGSGYEKSNVEWFSIRDYDSGYLEYLFLIDFVPLKTCKTP